MRPARRALAVLVAIAVGIPGSVTPAEADTPEFQAWHSPPALILRGENVVLRVDAETTDSGEPFVNAFVRDDPDAPFTRLRMLGGTRRVPERFLDGGFLEDYVRVEDPGTGQILRVPGTGSFRSWIRESLPVIDLGRHRFGHVRSPGAIVARASTGDGVKQVAFYCPPEGICESPWSFDVGPSGEVWVLDPHHQRLQGWTAGHPDAPVRRIHLPFGPADVAVGPHGMVFVSGVKLGDPIHHLRLYAYAPNGEFRWRSHLLADIFNDHIRFGPDGILYSVDPRYGWAPAIGSDGKPLTIAQQRKLARPYEPLPGDMQLLTRYRSAKEQRVGLATEAGRLVRAWRVTGDNPMDETEVPDAVGGDPVVLFGVYDLQRHLKESLVLRLSPTDGVRTRLSLGAGITDGGSLVTTLRVGYDGKLYQLQGSPEVGVRVARYSLG